jgi:RNase P/RNase MRP subunit POP5
MKAKLREDYRYIRFKIISEKEYNKQEFEKHLRTALAKILGELGYAKCLPRLLYYGSGQGIIKVLRDGEKEARVALALVTKFDSSPLHLQTVFVSGTMKGCKAKK